MTFRVVPIAEEHIEGFRAGVDSVSRERRYLTFLEAPPLEATRKFVRNSIREGYPHYVALEGDDVIGWCDILPIDRPTRAHTGVLGIGVLAPFRGQGVGSALLRQALDQARSSGFTRVELSVRAGNRRVVSLYQRFGFVEEGLQRNAIRLDGQYEHLICMAVLFD